MLSHVLCRFEASARKLTRSALKSHLRCHLKIDLHTFEHAQDVAWLEFILHEKVCLVNQVPLYYYCPSHFNRFQPAFIMTTDGSALPTNAWAAVNAHLQLLLSQLSIATLELAEYKDSKILAHLYDNKRAKSDVTASDLANYTGRSSIGGCGDDLHQYTGSSSLVEVYTSLLASKAAESGMAGLCTLAVLLDFHVSSHADLGTCAQKVAHLAVDLNRYLSQDFLPAFFDNLAAAIDKSDSFPLVNINVRIMRALLRAICEGKLQDLPATFAQLAASVGISLEAILSLAQSYAPPVHIDVDLPSFEQDHLLHFDNELLNDLLPKFDNTSDSAHSEKISSGTAVQFATLFVDDKHWHNAKAIIRRPGPPPKLDPRTEKRLHRSMQRFMAALQLQAASLTGADGALLKQQVILASGRGKPKEVNKMPKQSYQPTGKSSKSSEKQLSKADKIRADNTAAKCVDPPLTSNQVISDIH